MTDVRLIERQKQMFGPLITESKQANVILYSSILRAMHDTEPCM